MKLPRTVDRVLLLVTVFILSFVGAFALQKNHSVDTYADNENGTFIEAEEYFVTFYDEGERLTVKTDAPTVGEALERAGILINETDIVEPGLMTEITTNNFFINIHRSRPAVVKDGVKERYVMTASYDPKTIAREAGLTIYDGDEVKSAPNTNFLETGVANMYEVVRNGGRTVTVEEEIGFAEETVKDYNLAPGVREVRQLGEVGLLVKTYDVFYENNVEVRRELMSEERRREPVNRIVAVGASEIERTPLTASRGVNIYTVRVGERVIERKETYYDLNMALVMRNAATMCGVEPVYTIRDDGAKVDADGYVLVAAELTRYPRCSVVETSLGPGKVYDTGTFAQTNPEQFDLATDWTVRDGK
ncbi:G5 domain-containing protein [Candidatus Saccharibacteria bacterium]|nr:G5 domain-containing protein [Candidatus Saccharibacteria bacterium]